LIPATIPPNVPMTVVSWITTPGEARNPRPPIGKISIPIGVKAKAGARLAYDMIYRPAETRLLQKAKTAGCRTANGLGMLLYQGAKALEIWSGQPAPLSFMRAALEINIYG
jgi:shikimate 5-dehydrogenase